MLKEQLDASWGPWENSAVNCCKAIASEYKVTLYFLAYKTATTTAVAQMEASPSPNVKKRISIMALGGRGKKTVKYVYAAYEGNV